MVIRVGFLGATDILKQDLPDRVRGLSTTATIWVVAILGLLIGAREVTTGLTLAGFVLVLNVAWRPRASRIAARTATPPDPKTERVLEG